MLASSKAQTIAIRIPASDCPGKYPKIAISSAIPQQIAAVAKVYGHIPAMAGTVFPHNIFLHQIKGFLILVAYAQVAIKNGMNAIPPPTNARRTNSNSRTIGPCRLCTNSTDHIIMNKLTLIEAMPVTR